MFKVGQLIIYSKAGVCEVKAVGKIDIPYINKEKDYYTLEPCFDNGTVYVPVDTDMPMREVMSKEEAEETILMIPKVKLGNINIHKANDAKNAFNKRLSTQEIEDLILVVKTLLKKSENAKSEGKAISTTDQNYMKHAEKLLFGEFAVALGIDYDEVKPYIEKKLARKRKKKQKEE